MPSGLAGGPIYRRRCRLAGTVVEAGNVQPRPHINVMWIWIEGPRRSRVERGREPRCGGVALLTTKTAAPLGSAAVAPTPGRAEELADQARVQSQAVA